MFIWSQSHWASLGHLGRWTWVNYPWANDLRLNHMFHILQQERQAIPQDLHYLHCQLCLPPISGVVDFWHRCWYGWHGDWPQMLVICTDGYMMKKSKCQKCRPLSAVPAYVWNLEGHSTVFWKAGVNRGSNAERKAVAACRLLCWQQLWKPKYALDISQKIISNIVSFVTFVCFLGFFFEYVAVCLQDVNQNFSDTVWVSSLLIIINLPGRKKHA